MRSVAMRHEAATGKWGCTMVCPGRLLMVKVLPQLKAGDRRGHTHPFRPERYWAGNEAPSDP